MLSAPYVGSGFNPPFLIEYLDLLKDRGNPIESAKYIGKLFVEMLKSFTPDYDKVHIRSIVEFLYERKDEEIKALADSICNQYGERQVYDNDGNLFLRDLYERYSYRNE